MSSIVIVKETTPAEAGIKKATAGKDDDENGRNCDYSILDKGEAPVIFSGSETRRV